MVKTSTLWLLGQNDRHHVRSYTCQAMTATKVAREDVMPEIPEKKQLPISKTHNSNNWLLLLILRTKEGRKSKLSRKKCSPVFFFFSFTGDLNQQINALEKLRDKFSANSRINTWFVTFFFSWFYDMYLISSQLNKLFRKKAYSAAWFRDRPPLRISLDKTWVCMKHRICHAWLRTTKSTQTKMDLSLKANFYLVRMSWVNKLT